MASTSPQRARSRWPAGSHSRSRCSPSGSGCSWHQASRARPVPRARLGRRGRAARCGMSACPRTSTSSTRRSHTGRCRGRSGSRPARSCSTTRTRRVRRGTRLVQEVVDRYTVSKDGRTYTFDVEEDIPLPHRCQGDSAELRRRVQSGSRNPRLELAGDRLHARDRRRRQSDRRQGAIDLRRPRARPLPAANPADQASRGLHRPTDTAVLLPGPAEHADRASSTTRRARALTTSYERVVNQRIVLKRNPFYRGDRPANVDQVVYTISESQEACLARRRAGPRSTSASSASPRRRTGPWPRSTASTGPAGSSSSAHCSLRGSWRSTTTGRRSGAPARSRSRRRSTTRSTGPRWSAPSAIWQASAPTSCCLPRSPALRASTRSGAPTPPPRGSGWRGRGSGRTR